ncbi:hypothetical protein GCM10010271_65140 [Streptomyces kurssanovii]|nr:hypothetical protein GCM10010271_65140 [Streptomyces kurssanovii]
MTETVRRLVVGMEIVKGRAVSRTGTGYADVAAVVEAVVDICGYTAGSDAQALAGYVKYVRQTSRASLEPASFVSPSASPATPTF